MRRDDEDEAYVDTETSYVRKVPIPFLMNKIMATLEGNSIKESAEKKPVRPASKSLISKVKRKRSVPIVPVLKLVGAVVKTGFDLKKHFSNKRKQ